MIIINTSFKKIYSLLGLTFLFFLILIKTTYSEEKIGSIVSLKNEVYAVDADGEKRLLDLYDEIFLKDEILTNELSTATVQYDDNSTVIIKKSSSFKVTDFNIAGLKDIFLGQVQKGSVIIESGKIAKKDNGSMMIELPTMNLEVKGTRFNIENKPDGTSEVSLAEDSFGNVGTINISSEGQVTTLYDTEQVVSVNLETGISERPKTEGEKKELVDFSNDLIEASFIDENVIQKNLEEKLANGNLLDANNDGVINSSDIDIIKKNITIEKQENINFIADYSTDEDTEFLSYVLNFSDDASIGQSMNYILEANDYLIASVVTNLAYEGNTFLTTSDLEVNNFIKEKIFIQMLNDTDDQNNNIEVIGSIFAKSDAANIGLMMDTIQTVGETNADSTLALEVLSSMADSESFDDMNFEDEEYFGDEEDFDDETQKQFDQMMEIQEQFDQMIEQAVFSAADSEEGAMMLANIMTEVDADAMGTMMDTIQTVGETNADSTLALEVLSSMADSESFDDMNFGDEEYFGDEEQKQFDQMMEIQEQFDQMMEEAVFSAVDSEEGAMMLANIMTEADADTMGTMMDTIGMVGETNADSTLALEVLSSMADSESFDDMDFEDEGQEQFDQMMEEAVFSAVDSEEGAMMLANIMTEADADTMGTMMDTIGMVGETNADSTLALEVLSSMADSESFDDMDFEDEGQEQFDQMMEEAVFSAVDSEEGAMMLANIITKADADTMGTMMDTIGMVGETNADSTLALEVLSSMADSESFDDMDFEDEGKEQFDQMMEEAVFSAVDSEEGAMMLANIITKGDAITAGAMLDNIAIVSAKDPYSTLAVEVMSSVATTASTSNTYIDTNKMVQFTEFINTTTSTTLATTAATTAIDDVATTALSTTATTTDDTALYDAAGFAFLSPYYHKDTDNMYNLAGFDKDGNTSASVLSNSSESYDSAGFNMNSPYYHKDTNNIYNLDGIDKYGNSSGAVDSPTVTWMTQASSSADASYTTSDEISLTASAMTTGNGVTYSVSGKADLSFTAGTLSGSPTVANSPYSIEIVAQDSSCEPSCTGVARITDTVSFTVTGGGDPTVTWMTQASSSADASYTTSDEISLTASAMTTGNGVTYSVSGKADLSFTAGTLSGSPTVANSPYSIEIVAQDSSCEPSCTGVARITDTVSFTVTGGGDPTVTWMTQASSSADASYTTSDEISLTASAMTTGNGVTYSVSGKADLSFTAGTLSGSPTVANSPYSIEIVAQDSSCEPSCTGVARITDTVSFTVTGGGDPTVTWMTQASSSADASYTTSDEISLTASAMTTGNGVTYSVSGKADLSFTAGTLSGSPTVANSPYSIEIVAQDSSCEPSCTGVARITDTVSFTVTGGGDPTVTWMTQASSSADASYTTSDEISLTASAMTTGNGVTYSVSGKADLSFTAGTLSGSPTVANSPYSIEIVAQDSSCEPSCTGVARITDTVSFTVTGGEYDGNGFLTIYPYTHQNGTPYDGDGYNHAGYNSSGRNNADQYLAMYDVNASP